MCVHRKNCINDLFSKAVEWIYFMMIITTCLMPRCSASQLWIGLAVHFHVLPSQLGMGRICSLGFAGSKVSPVFQASLEQFPHDPPVADWGCGLCGDLIYHLTLGTTLQEKGALSTAWLVFQACRVWSALLHLKVFLMCSGSCLPEQKILMSLWARSSTSNASISLRIPMKKKTIVSRRKTSEELEVIKNLSWSKATQRVFWACSGTFPGEGSSGVGPSGHPRHQPAGAQCASQTKAVSWLEMHPTLQSAIIKFF